MLTYSLIDVTTATSDHPVSSEKKASKEASRKSHNPERKTEDTLDNTNGKKINKQAFCLTHFTPPVTLKLCFT